MATDKSSDSTKGHRRPRRRSKSTAEPALLVVFPKSYALPIPPPLAPLGRDWFARHGLLDHEISKSHFKLHRDGTNLQIEDAGSRNGTWVDGEQLRPSVATTLEDGAIVRAGNTLLVYRESLEGPLEASPPLGELVGPFGLRQVRSRLDAMRRHPPKNVFIGGETGTGKELLAATVAQTLGRCPPYAALNVASIAAGVFESQLFGHVAGAFSDAKQASQGVVRAHEGGTVFLDEIAELPSDLQPKLLRLLENHEILPVGSQVPVKVDVLLLAASSRSIEALVEDGSLRRDLYARLAVARLQIAPLRERLEDLFAIASRVAPNVGLDLDTAHTEVEAVERLMREPWRNNVRELIATLGEIAAIDPSPGLSLWSVHEVLGARPSTLSTRSLNTQSVEAAMQMADGNETRAAKLLGVSRGKLRRYRKKG